MPTDPSLGIWYAAPSATIASGPVFVAGDGTTSWTRALAIARELAERLHAGLEIVSVLEPTIMIVPPLYSSDTPPHRGENRIQSRRARLRALCGDMSADGPPCSTRILFGDPPSSIARAADAHGASLIVTGRVPHGMIARALRRETPLATVRGGRVPVLSASASAARLPRRIVVAVESGASAARLAPIVGALFSEALAVHLVTVGPRDAKVQTSESRVEQQVRDHRAQRAFARAMGSWTLPAGVLVDTHLLTGEPGATLAEFVGASGADLLVIGQPRPKQGPHLPIAHLATRMYRTVSCATLIVPRDDDADSGLQAKTSLSVDVADWPALLRDFTRRNAGRVASLTVEETGGPPRFVVDGWTLSGVDCDPSASAIAIALFDPWDVSHHLSHLVASPGVVAVHDAVPGRDELLVIGYDGGQITLALGVSGNA